MPAGQNSVHGHPALSRETESAWTGTIPKATDATTLQVRVLTADITNLLFAAVRVAFLAPADRSPNVSHRGNTLAGPDAHPSSSAEIILGRIIDRRRVGG